MFEGVNTEHTRSFVCGSEFTNAQCSETRIQHDIYCYEIA